MVAIATTLVAAACSSTTEPAPEAVGTAPTPRPSPTTVERVAPVVPNEASAEVIRAERRYRRVEPLGDLQELLGVAPTMIPPGEITTDLLGTPLTLTTEDWWRLELAGPGRIDIVSPDTRLDPLTPRLSVLRLPGWFADRWLRLGDIQVVGAPPEVRPNDLLEWIAGHRALELIDRTETGAGIEVVDVAVSSDVPLGIGARYCPNALANGCIPLAFGGTELLAVAPDSVFRTYRLDSAELPVVAIARFASDDPRRDRFDDLVAGLTVGPEGPPVLVEGVLATTKSSPYLSATHSVAAIPGLVIDALDHVDYDQRPGEIRAGALSIAQPVLTGDGQALTIGDDVIAALMDPQWGLEVDERPPVEVLGTEARAFDVTGGPSTVLQLVEVDPGDDPVWGAWFTAEAVRVWVADTPIGPLLVSSFGRSLSAVEGGATYTRRAARQIRIDCALADCVEAGQS